MPETNYGLSRFGTKFRKLIRFPGALPSRTFSVLEFRKMKVAKFPETRKTANEHRIAVNVTLALRILF